MTYCYIENNTIHPIPDGPFGIGPDGKYHRDFYDGDGGTNYPPNWLQLASSAEKLALGLHELQEEPLLAPVDDRYYFRGTVDVIENGVPSRRQIATMKSKEMILDQRINELAAYRYEKENGGMTVNGMNVKTDDRSKSLLNGAVSLCQINPAATVSWKTDSGFVLLNATQVIAIGAAVGTFVQECFTAEGVHSAMIMALATAEEIIAYDFTTGWPA